MKAFMEKPDLTNEKDVLEEILRNKEKFITDIRNSPAVIRKNREAVEQLSTLKPPFPWDNDCAQKKDQDNSPK